MKDFEITLSNGYTVQLFKYEGKAKIAILDEDGDFVSETVFSETEKKSLKEMADYFTS